jgi:hypothetical protein
LESALFSDHFDTGFGMLTCRSSIVTSRKRKLRELYAIAYAPEGLAGLNSIIADDPAATPGEIKFLADADLSLYVYSARTIDFGRLESRLRPGQGVCC